VVEDAMLSPGSRVAGEVRRSVVGPGAVVEAGAVVADSVLLDGVHIGQGVRLQRCIVDDGVRLTVPATHGRSDEVTVIGDGDGDADA
jgi:glucose-1-phosphate adenylyltransferase